MCLSISTCFCPTYVIFVTSKLALVDIFSLSKLPVLTLGNLALTLSNMIHFRLYVVVMLREYTVLLWKADPLDCIRMLIYDFKSSASAVPLFSSLVSSFVFPPHQLSCSCFHLWILLLLHPPRVFSFPLAQNPLFTSFCFLSYPEWSLFSISLDRSVWWELWTRIHCFPQGHGLLSLWFTQGITCYEFVFFILVFSFLLKIDSFLLQYIPTSFPSIHSFRLPLTSPLQSPSISSLKKRRSPRDNSQIAQNKIK